MKILRAFEFVAAALVMAAIVLSLGAAFVGQIVAMSDTTVRRTVVVLAPTEDEVRGYIAAFELNMKMASDKLTADMEKQAAGVE